MRRLLPLLPPILLAFAHVHDARAQCEPSEVSPICYDPETSPGDSDWPWDVDDEGQSRPSYEDSPGAERAAAGIGTIVLGKAIVAVDASKKTLAPVFGREVADDICEVPEFRPEVVPLASEYPPGTAFPLPTDGGDRDGQPILGDGKKPATRPRGTAESEDVGADPIDPLNGEVVIAEVDLQFPGFGVPFEHVRTYRSRMHFLGTLGYAWDHSYNRRLTEVDTEGCGGLIVYSTGALGTLRFEASADGYRSPRGVAARLEAIRSTTGARIGWRLVHPGGIEERFDARGLLVRIEDRNAQGIDFEWEPSGTDAQWRMARAVDSVGRVIDYDYDARGYLVSVSGAGLTATYQQDDQGDLVRVTTAGGRTERYEYEANPLYDGIGLSYQVEGALRAGCETACAPSADSCLAGGVCDVAAAWESECVDECANCPTLCADGCNTACGGACRDECASECAAGCGTAEAAAEIDALCDELWSVGGDGVKPFEDYCGDCDETCEAQCGLGCDVYLACVFSSNPLSCFADAGIRLTLGTAETVLDLVDVVLNAIAEGIICGLTKVCSFFGLCEDKPCTWEETEAAIHDTCERDCVQCCAYGEKCGAESCNAGHTCESDCRSTFFGEPLGPPTLGGAEAPWDACSAVDESCAKRLGRECRRTCESDCVGPCKAECRPLCEATCIEECPTGDCGIYCAALDFEAQCMDQCADACMADAHATQGGPRYGHLKDLNHNLLRAYDGNGRLFMENTYGTDFTDPSFDAVTMQTFGTWTLEMDYRDLASEARAEIPLPAPGSLAEQALRRRDYEAVDVCPICLDGGDDCDARRATGDEASGWLLPERATIVRDAFGATWVYYYDGQYRKIRAENLDAGTRWSWSYDDRGYVTGIEAPMGDRTCLTHDDHGNVMRVVEYPVPGAIGSAEPIRRNFSYRSALPYRLTTVWDPRDPSRVLMSYSYDELGNLTGITDGSFNTTVIVPDERGGPGLVITPDGSETRYDWISLAPTGSTLRITRDAGGPQPFVETTQFDGAGRPTQRTATLGPVTKWAWSGGTLASITESADGWTRKTGFSYDADGQVRYVNDGVLETWLMYHPTGHLAVRGTHALDGGTSYDMECFKTAPTGRLLERVLPEGNRVRIDYDPEGRVRSVVAGVWAPSSEAWDDGCRSSFAGIPAMESLGTVDYDLNGNPVYVVDGRFAATELEYDGFGRLARATNADGVVAQYGYDELGNAVWRSVHDYGVVPPYEAPARPTLGWTPGSLAAAEELVYDAAGRLDHTLAWHFDQDGPIGDGLASTSYSYDLTARRFGVRNDRGDATIVSYDGLGRPVFVEYPTGDTVATTYNLLTRTVTEVTRAPTPTGTIAQTTHLTSWGAPSQVTVQGPSGPAKIASYAYDPRGRLATATNAAGLFSSVSYDAFDRVWRTSTAYDGGTETTTLAYDRNGNVIRREAVGTAPASTTTYRYDALDRLRETVRPDATLDIVRYDGGSALPTSVTDPRGVTLSFEHTPAGLRGAVQVVGAGARREYNYDALGRVVAAHDFGAGKADVTDDVVTTFGWDSLGNRIYEHTNLIGYPVSHEVDAVGLPVASDLGPLNVQRTFDPAGRLSAVYLDHSTAASVDFTYAGLGGPTRRRYANGIVTTYGYDVFGRLESQSEGRVGTNPLARWTWEAPIDGVPRVATLERAGLRGVTSVFQPDRALRLVQETHNVAAAVGTTIAPDASWNAGNAAVAGYTGAGKPWRTYTLDSRHNWKTVKSDTAPVGMTTAVNALDAYLSFAGEAPLYDAAGNVTQRDDDRFTYDAYGQLVELRVDGRMFGYRYDALGRVVEETDRSTGASTLFGYDGNRRTLRRDPAGLLHVMVDGDGLDEHLVQLTAGVPSSVARKYYHQDRQGSVYLVTDRNGAPQEWYRYSAYGELTIESSTGSPRLTSAIGNRFGYQGHLFNESTGLVHMRARFYDPTWGRFLTQDPLGLIAGPNRYAFVDSAPLSFIDPLGLTKRPSGADWTGLPRSPGQACSVLQGFCTTPMPGGWDDFINDMGLLKHYAGGVFRGIGRAIRHPIRTVENGVRGLIQLPTMLGEGAAMWWIMGTDSTDAQKQYVVDDVGLDPHLSEADVIGQFGESTGEGLVFDVIIRGGTTAFRRGRQGLTRRARPPKGSVGAMRRLDYEPNPKHGPVARGDASPAPANGQAALDTSIPAGGNSSRRVGIDYGTGDFVVFQEHLPGRFHGYVVPWGKLTQGMQSALRRAGMADKKGRILTD